jgi:uncharacterized membrane protein
MEQKQTKGDGWGKAIRGQFMAGLLVIVPLGASILILIWIFSSVDNILQPIIRLIWGNTIPGVGFGVTIIVIYLAGVVAKNIVGRRIIKWGDSVLNKVPVFRLLYRGIRQIMDSFAAPDKTGFMQVVLVEFPKPGVKTVGFITNELTDSHGNRQVSVLVPTAPNPTSGFLIVVREEELIRTKIPVDDAVKMIVSAGRMMPAEVQKRL